MLLNSFLASAGLRSLTVIVGLLGVSGFAISRAEAIVSIEGQVEAGGGSVAGSNVTLWAASAGEPKQLAQAKTGDDGRFALNSDETPGSGVNLYIIAKGGVASVNKGAGDNPALSFLSVLGGTAPAKAAVNEMTTVASVWTHAQFLDGLGIKGPPLSLGIAASNVANFVDRQTGGYGVAILDTLNSTDTPTMANFATLANVFAGCATRVTATACDNLFIATVPPKGDAPTDTLGAAISIAHNMAYKPKRVFALLDAFYPVPKGKTLRPTPFQPYLSFAPSAWVLPLKFTGGGLNAPGKIMFDSAGNAWTGVNFIVGSQGSDILWDGNLSEFSPSGRPLSPAPAGFAGGGLEGPGFGAAIDANDRVWVTSTTGHTISLFDTL